MGGEKLFIYANKGKKNIVNRRGEKGMDQQFIRYLFITIWRTHFRSKRKMAAALDVTYRTLQKNFELLGSQKGATIATTNLFIYCCQHGISIDQLYTRFADQANEKRGIVLIRKRKIQLPFSWIKLSGRI